MFVGHYGVAIHWGTPGSPRPAVGLVYRVTMDGRCLVDPGAIRH